MGRWQVAGSLKLYVNQTLDMMPNTEIYTKEHVAIRANQNPLTHNNVAFTRVLLNVKISFLM